MCHKNRQGKYRFKITEKQFMHIDLLLWIQFEISYLARKWTIIIIQSNER